MGRYFNPDNSGFRQAIGSRIYVVISSQAHPVLVEYLKSLGLNLMFFGPITTVQEPVSCHPDLIYAKLDDRTVFKGDPKKLSPIYPNDIRYNVCSTGRYLICKISCTDRGLLAQAGNMGLSFIDIKQGYAKCSIAVVDEHSIITYDMGIAKACRREGIDVLTVSHEGVLLPGYNRGFIGGASGLVGNKLIFNGDLSSHPDFKSITSFVRERGIEPVYFDGYPLTDIGSIICMES